MHFFTSSAAILVALPLVLAQQEVIQHQTTVVVVDYYPAVKTSTAWLTDVITILGCPPGTPNCPVNNANSVVVVTATTGVRTTVCPLTLKQARLSSFATTAAVAEVTGGPLSTTTTTWPTTYDLPSSWPSLSSYDIPSSVWASIFPTGLPTFTPGDPFYDSAAASPTLLSPSESSALSWFDAQSYSTAISIHESISTIPSVGNQSVMVTSGSFTAVFGSNVTSVVQTYDASTMLFNYTAGGAAVSSGYNGSAASTGYSGAAASSDFNGAATGNASAVAGATPSSGFATATTASNGTFTTGAPVPLQTVNDSPVVPVPVNQVFGLLVAIAALAFAL